MDVDIILVVDYGDGPQAEEATLGRLAELLEMNALTSDAGEILNVYRLEGAELVKANYKVTGRNDYDSNDMAYPLVTLYNSAGVAVGSVGYTVDGRA